MEMTMPNNDELSRIIILSKDIDGECTSNIISQILNINETDKNNLKKFKEYMVKPIQLYIQSFGGSVYDMFALIDIIESSNTPVYTYCSGYCMSAGALIFMAGHKRFMMKHSTLMLHQLQCMLIGKLNDINITSEEMHRLDKCSKKFIKKHSELPKNVIKRIFTDKEDVYLTSKQCLKYGICDEVRKKL